MVASVVLLGASEGLFSFSVMVDRWVNPFCGSLGDIVEIDAGFDLWLCLPILSVCG